MKDLEYGNGRKGSDGHLIASTETMGVSPQRTIIEVSYK